MEGKVFSILNTRGLHGVTGIYKIGFKNTTNFYIGSSKNIGVRMNQHRRGLILYTHRNECLINAYNKHGLDNCYVEVIKVCDLNELITYEQHFLDALKPEYNIAKLATGGKPSKLSEEDILQIRFDYYNRSYTEDVYDIANRYDIAWRYVLPIAESKSFPYIQNPPELQEHINKNKRRIAPHKNRSNKKKYAFKHSLRTLTREQVGMIRWAIVNNKSITELYKHIGISSSSRHLVSRLIRNKTYVDYQELVDASHLNLPPAQNIKVKMEDIPKIRWATQQGIPHGEIAKVFGCSKDTSGGIKVGRYYSYIEGVEPCGHLFNK